MSGSIQDELGNIQASRDAETDDLEQGLRDLAVSQTMLWTSACTEPRRSELLVFVRQLDVELAEIVEQRIADFTAGRIPPEDIEVVQFAAELVGMFEEEAHADAARSYETLACIDEGITRNDEALARIREESARIREGIARNDEALARNDEALARSDEALVRNGKALARNREALARFRRELALARNDEEKFKQARSSPV